MITENTRTAPGCVLIRISEAERKKLFEREIRRLDGETAFLVIDEQADDEQEKSFSQAVSVGTIVCIGPEVYGLEVGDIALLDYTVDKTAKFVVYSDSTEKVVKVDTRTVYKEDELVIDANKRTPHPTLVHEVGDLEEGTLLIAVIRGGIILPLWPYIVLEHRKPRAETVIKGGVWQLNDKEHFSDRRVIAAYSGSEYKAGDVVICESDGIFDRKLDNKAFDVVFEHDIAAVLLNE